MRAGRSEPYPTTTMIQYLAERGARFVLSSDSHTTETLRKGFDEWAEKLTALGVKPEQWAELQF